MEEIEAPSPIDFKPEKSKLEFILKESFEIKSDNKIFILSISYNDNLILFEVEIKDIFPKEEYNIYLSLEQLGKINKYFLQFDSLKEVFESLKFLIQKNFLNIFEEEKNMKIKLINLVNGKEIIINIPLKQKDLKAEIDSIIPYVIKLNEKISNLEQKVKLHEDKIENLEKKLNEIYVYKPYLENLKLEKEVIEIKDEDYDLFKSNILKKEELGLFLSWFAKKPNKIKLLLDSKIDGDLTKTFYKKCGGKFPTVVLVKTQKDHRFGGYTTFPWNNLKHSHYLDKESFIFSLEKKKKYNIKNQNNAIQSYDNYFAFGGGTSDIYITNNCTSNNDNYNDHKKRTYDTTERHELNFGERYFTVSSYEVYQINY